MKSKSYYSKFLISIGVLGFIMSALSIVLLSYFYRNAKKNLADASKNLRAIGQEYIEDTVYVNTNIPVDTEIRIEGSVPIKINMNINDSLPIIMSFDLDSFSIPVSIDLNTVLHIDTILFLPDTLFLKVSGQIPVDQKFLISKLLRMGVNADIPLRKEMLAVKIDSPTTFISDVPIKLNINKIIPVKVPTIQINQKIKIDLPIKENVRVSFPQKLKIKGFIPIHLKIPIKIPLSKTPLKIYLDSTAKDLNKIFIF